jgi:hypothetical protein
VGYVAAKKMIALHEGVEFLAFAAGFYGIQLRGKTDYRQGGMKRRFLL